MLAGADWLQRVGMGIGLFGHCCLVAVIWVGAGTWDCTCGLVWFDLAWGVMLSVCLVRRGWTCRAGWRLGFVVWCWWLDSWLPLLVWGWLCSGVVSGVGIKTKEPGQLALLRLHKGRLPTLPLSQYHRRGEA